MSSLVLCLNVRIHIQVMFLKSEKGENKVNAMNCITYLGKTVESRHLLSSFDVFNIIMTNLIRAVEYKDKNVSNSAIAALAYFSCDRPYRILLANANQMFNFYEMLM